MSRVSDRRNRGLFAGWGVAVCCLILACATSSAGPSLVSDGSIQGERPSLVSDGRYVMGTVLELTLASSGERAGRAWIDEAFGQVAELEQLFSSHDPDSELSRLNAAAGGGP